jgi:Tn7-like transposition protein D/TniQ
MIAFFPSFYPDELVFSACSRYHERMGYRSSFCTGRDLFGRATVRIAVDLPNRLGDLSKMLPFGHSYTPDRMLTQHTLFPIYTAFESLKRATDLRKGMLNNRYSVHAFAGALTIKLRSQFLRYCTECVAEDRATWGETYWHRIHNVTGVEVCPIHNTFLVDSLIPIRRASNLEAFITAETAITTSAKRPNRTFYETYTLMARELLWLLNRGSLSCDRPSRANRYGRLLHESGFATFSGVVRRAKLEDALKEFYPAGLLRTLQSEVDRNSGWIPAITQPRHKSGQPPYRHILILNFLGCSLARFFSLPDTPLDLFGAGPWPCLNRAAEHFKKPVVVDCRLRMATDGTSRPLGIFKCECGFVYSRLGPDQTEDDRFRYHRIRAYGPVWREKMKTLLLKEQRSRKETAMELGVSTVSVKNMVGKLPESKSSSRKISSALLEERRAHWLVTVKQHPGLTRNQLRIIAGNAVYYALRRYDREWLEMHSPPKARLKASKPSTNWREKDREVGLKVSDVVADILRTPGKPIRYSATLIARRLGVLETLYKRHPDLLPQTRAAIAGAAESVIDFAIRRVFWAADAYKTDGVAFNMGQLKARAGLSYHIEEQPKVAAVLNSLVQDCETNRRTTEDARRMVEAE